MCRIAFISVFLRRKFLALIAFYSLEVLFGAAAPVQAQDDEVVVRAMTFNLKFASSRGPNAWTSRRPILKNAILDSNPDLIGTQEGLYEQIKNIDEDLEAYDWIGEGREGGSAGEFMAVFFKRERFKPVAYGHFWLSETPEVIGSKSWDSSLPRMVTWVRFQERRSGLNFFHFNTHFDHRSEQAREKSAELLIRRIRDRGDTLPVIVTGDFNASQGGRVHQTMLAPDDQGFKLADTWEAATAREGKQVGTIHGWRGSGPGDRRIDWVLASPAFRCESAQVVTYGENGRWPSDHFPVLSVLRIPAPGK